MPQNINLDSIREVAYGLKELRERVVFIGGAILGLYVDRLSADPVRFTKDVDLTIELGNLGQWVAMQERLAELGFSPNPEETVICRYVFKGILVDIMPTSDTPFGPSNAWYQPGFRNSIKHNLDPDLDIRLLSLAYFLATKFAAWHGRGSDPRTSHDFEDIIYITDNCSNLITEIHNSDPIVILDGKWFAKDVIIP